MQEQLSPIGAATEQALILLDPATLAIVQTGGCAQEVLGFSSARLCEMSLTDIVADPPPEQLRKLLRAMTDADGGELTLRVSLRDKSGRTIPAELLLVRLAGPEEQPLTAVARFYGDRAGRDSAPRLEPGDTKFVDFAGRLGHDLNNLLSTVIGSLGLIREDVLEDSDDEKLQLVDDALSAGRECADLVDRLMTAAGKQFLRPRRVAVNSIIERLAPLLKQTLPADIEVQVSLDPDVPDLNLDPDRLEAAILDLVVNAREAMPSGGELTISSGMGRAAGALPTLASDQDYVQITVRDAGAGIPEALRGRILEPLFTTKSGGSGRGLGLSMVNGFVQQSRGALSVDSTPNRGTCVTLNFPAAD